MAGAASRDKAAAMASLRNICDLPPNVLVLEESIGARAGCQSGIRSWLRSGPAGTAPAPAGQLQPWRGVEQAHQQIHGNHAAECRSSRHGTDLIGPAIAPDQ